MNTARWKSALQDLTLTDKNGRPCVVTTNYAEDLVCIRDFDQIEIGIGRLDLLHVTRIGGIVFYSYVVTADCRLLTNMFWTYAAKHCADLWRFVIFHRRI